MALLALGFGYTMAFEDPQLSGVVVDDNNGARVRWGINERYWPQYWKAGPPSLDDALACYRESFWKPLHAGELTDQALANRVVDCGFNTGGEHPIPFLQRAINICCGATQQKLIEEDRVIGRKTVLFANRMSAFVLSQFQGLWLAHIDDEVRKRPQDSRYAGNWRNRARGIFR